MYSSNKLEIKKYLFVVAWREGGWRGAVSVAGEKGGATLMSKQGLTLSALLSTFKGLKKTFHWQSIG